MKETVTVQPILASETYAWLLNKHYAKRLCPISHAFGAYRGNVLIGVVTYGVPVSSPLRKGVCGDDWKDHVLELNRLVCENSKNMASRLVGQSLRMLPRPTIVVSYADIAQGHVGYVYQACNFIYTGLSAKRTNWTVEGHEQHSHTIADESRGRENRSEWIRGKYGDAFSLSPRSRKHRYVYFCGSRTQVKELRNALRYPVEPYPKGDSSHYDSGGAVPTQLLLIA